MQNLDDINIPEQWKLKPEDERSQQINQVLTEHAQKLVGAIRGAYTISEKLKAIHDFFAKYEKLTQCSSCREIGIESKETRQLVYNFALLLDVADEGIYKSLWEAQNLPQLESPETEFKA